MLSVQKTSSNHSMVLPLASSAQRICTPINLGQLVVKSVNQFNATRTFVNMVVCVCPWVTVLNVSVQQDSPEDAVKLTSMSVLHNPAITVLLALIYLRDIGVIVEQAILESTVKKKSPIVETTLVLREPCAKTNQVLVTIPAFADLDILE